MCQIHLLSLFPSQAALPRGDRNTFIESRNYLISLACLYEMCLASQWLQGGQSPANRAAACPRNGPANRRTACSWVDWDPWLFCGCFCFSSQKQCLQTPGDFPSPIRSGSQASLTSSLVMRGREITHEVIRGNTSMIAGSERAVPVWPRKTRQTFWNSAWHSVGIQAVSLEQNWLPDCHPVYDRDEISTWVTSCHGLPGANGLL